MTLEFSGVTLAGPLWTVAQAKVHLKIEGTDSDADITQKLAMAQSRILRDLGLAGDATWTPATAPPEVAHAILLLTAYYIDDRGDGSTPDVWPKIDNLLSQHRDPVVRA